MDVTENMEEMALRYDRDAKKKRANYNSTSLASISFVIVSIFHSLGCTRTYILSDSFLVSLAALTA